MSQRLMCDVDMVEEQQLRQLEGDAAGGPPTLPESMAGKGHKVNTDGSPRGWLYKGDRSYFVTPARYTHLECIDACHRLSDQTDGEPVALACIDSAAATDFVANTVFGDFGPRDYGYTGPYLWLGHHQWPIRHGSEAGWKPATVGCDDSYSHWRLGEPDDFFAMQDCVAVDADGGWRDEGCYMRYRCLCERGAVLVDGFRDEEETHLASTGSRSLASRAATSTLRDAVPALTLMFMV
ncbi:hypothetical protein EMIHUDRAFT_200730 [Emiliania huxleyi CCMP1516]|uniref:C-type lectin domain-containing protein n=2 Tax=Emiliania huxleyi TaxID=2903 RepID=A0A0D3KR19_EMIH1|nr:hypothetical protein EMIHUDRAFT_200730 [Emiliania huxleyi CCMP1516]EOD38204.1 hypothetical protein EMIHUDRAFT_200730 [Emiliania huxleyi CCMP1516]|eukprot:XP_005790633.1 hypothetical protein EMIHUDRAFT_200730 [Emiliania huxleyi CCMP1516]